MPKKPKAPKFPKRTTNDGKGRGKINQVRDPTQRGMTKSDKEKFDKKLKGCASMLANQRYNTDRDYQGYLKKMKKFEMAERKAKASAKKKEEQKNAPPPRLANFKGNTKAERAKSKKDKTSKKAKKRAKWVDLF
eukprot:SAG11_NODE_7768_length_1098_cov_27.314314_2_plen_134_part_00